MPDSVTQWLELLGLGQYTDAFEENAIELDQLSDLGHDTLEAVGVLAVGHRMKILKAAAKLERAIVKCGV